MFSPSASGLRPFRWFEVGWAQFEKGDITDCSVGLQLHYNDCFQPINLLII